MRQWISSSSRLLLYLLVIAAVALAAPAQSTQHQQWTTEDGLPQDSVHQIFQSNDGYIWVGTEGGVARFNGTGFFVLRGTNDRNFTSDDVCCIAQTAGRSLWFGTGDGLIGYRDGTTHRFAEAAGLPSSQVLALAPADNGALLVLTSAGLSRFDGTHVLRLPLPDRFDASALSPAPDGTALVLAGPALFRYTHGAFVRLAVAPPPQALSVLESANGTLWFRTRTAIFQRNPNGSERLWQVGRHLAGTRLESLTVHGNQVFAGTNRGAFRLNPQTGQAEPISLIGPEAVLSVLVDAEGDRWFGTETSGLHILRDRTIATIPDLDNEVLTSVVEASDGTVWLGTRNDGLRIVPKDANREKQSSANREKQSHADPEKGSSREHRAGTPPVSAALTSQVILSLAAGKDGDIWVGTPDGLNHVRGTAVDHLTSANGLPDDFIRSVLAEPDGELWAGTRRGLAHLQHGRVTEVYTHAEGLRSDLVGALLRATDGDLWFGTLDGLARLRQGHLKIFTTVDGLPGNTITALAQGADGTLWVGSRQGGLSVADGERFRSFANPLLSQEADALLPDGTGALWLRTGTGILRASVADLHRCAGIQGTCSVALETFTSADGLPSVELPGSGHPVAVRTTGGALWFTTRRGIAIIDPDHLPQNTTPPPVALERFEVDGRPEALAGKLAIAPGRHRYQFGFAGLSFLAPARVTYRYQLQGFDTDWIEAGNRRSADYTNLPPGRFRFLVEARNNDGVRSLRPAELAFTVEPPFYRRWWFALLVLLGLGALVYAIYQLRLRRVRREFNAVLGERNRIAREIHDTLAQDFVGVSLQLEITAQLLKAEAVDAARHQIDETRTLVRNGIRDARESIWALRANAAAESLPARLREAVARARTEGLDIRFEVGGVYRALAGAAESELLRIAAEALQNIRKHAGATQVELDLRYQEEVILLRICDNGRGFDLREAESLTGHYGLRGMRERAATIGAILHIATASGEGTTLTLELPAHGEKRDEHA